MAMTNQYMQSAVNTMYEPSADERIQEQCRRRAEYEYYQKLQAEENAKLREEITVLRQVIADKDAKIAELDAVIADKDAKIAELDAVIADKDAKIAELERKLANVNKEE